MSSDVDPLVLDESYLWCLLPDDNQFVAKLTGVRRDQTGVPWLLCLYVPGKPPHWIPWHQIVRFRRVTPADEVDLGPGGL